MKNSFRILGVILLLFLLIIYSCKKDKTTIPVVSTTAITQISYATAISGGTVTGDGGATVTAKGICWNTSANPTTTNSKTTETGTSMTFVSNLSQLSPNTVYYVRAYATNSIGTGYGNEISFSTNPDVPYLTTTWVSSLTTNSTNSGGTIIGDGGAAITSRGVCWNSTVHPTIDLVTKTSNGTGDGTFISTITGLTPSTYYWIRAYATNSIGTSYGNELRINTYTGSVSDIEGTVYNTVTIGTQIWMVENLKTATYNDGSSITNIPDFTQWAALTTPAYCFYNNDQATYKSTYGALYNWYAVSTGNLCPTGWHVPAESEWQTLSTYLGGGSIAGEMIKEPGTVHWNNPNDASNGTSFTALPGGERSPDTNFFGLGASGTWYAATEVTSLSAWSHTLQNMYANLSSSGVSKNYGASVRCIKN